MSIRFAIRSAIGKAIKEGDATVRFSGRSEAFKGSEERDATAVGVDGAGNKKMVYNTGLDPEKVDLYRWYTDEEKKAVKKQIEEMRPLISKNYGGDGVIADTNSFFWKRNRDVNILSLNNQDLDKFYDTKYVTHALLYLSIISGAFMAMVAPTYQWAHDKQIPLYLALETDDVIDDQDDITKSDAHAALADLRKEESIDSLFTIAWCLQYDTSKYVAYTKSVPKRDLVNYLIQFIEGKLQMKKKKNTPKTFIDYAERWKKQQTRPLLLTEAYVKAGEYYSLIQYKDKKFVTSEGVELGSTIPQVIETLHKPKFTESLEWLRDQVEAKWKE